LSFLEVLMTWSDDRITTLSQLWSAGFSASQIAQRLGGVTRNAVIGKVHRLGLAARATTSRHRRPSRRPASNQRIGSRATRRSARPVSRIQSRRAPAKPKVRALPELGPAPPIPITMQTLTMLTCRWPQGDPKSPDFHFCGRRKTRGDGPYCDHHQAIAFR
jgi:GcrA cell cycle regulator